MNGFAQTSTSYQSVCSCSPKSAFLTFETLAHMRPSLSTTAAYSNPIHFPFLQSSYLLTLVGRW